MYNLLHTVLYEGLNNVDHIMTYPDLILALIIRYEYSISDLGRLANNAFMHLDRTRTRTRTRVRH